jgi:hypothetical protein
LENHDERRVASVLSPAEHRAAALLMLGLPGMRLMYEGQMHGRRHHVPVQMGCWPDEPAQPEIECMYELFLTTIKASAVGRGKCRLLHPCAGQGNDGAANFIIIQWQASSHEADLVVVNLSAHSGHCRVRPVMEMPSAAHWELRDLLDGGSVHLHGTDLVKNGIRFQAHAQGAHLFRLRPRWKARHFCA